MAATTELDLSSDTSVRSHRSLRVAERAKKRVEAQDAFLAAVEYFSQVAEGTPWKGNDVLERHLAAVERTALSRGLPPNAVSVLLDFALSLRMKLGISTRVLKLLIPASVVPQDAVVRGVSWLCVDKMPLSMQTLFVRWVITMFDMIDSKDQLRAIYGFIFSFVTEDSLRPYICHLLYLLTRKENIRPYRIRKLLDLQAKMGRQPYLMHLLSLYKVFCPEQVTLSVPQKMKSGFRNHNSTWKAALAVVQRNISANVSSDLLLTSTCQELTKTRKRKWDNQLVLPPINSSLQKQSFNLFPMEQLRTFPQLLENLHRIELPAQMGSMLGSTLALHFLDCVRDNSAFLRLNFWLGHALHEELLFCKDDVAQSPAEAIGFLSSLISAQCFLQESFTASEIFLYKFLTVWDGSFLRPQILALLNDIPVVPSSRIRPLVFEPLMQLFFTSSLFFKCSVIECLNGMLKKWLMWHSVYAFEDVLGISVTSRTPMSMTLSGLMDSVVELVNFVGRLATIGLQLEDYHPLLLSFTLDFYETVSEMYLQYDLPLVLIPPVGVFYPALLATDPVSVDRLCHIMDRYRISLMSAKKKEQHTQAFDISRKTYREFNQYMVSMVSCLWNSRLFQPGTDLEIDESLLTRSKVSEYWARFSLLYHPAFLGFAIDFHQNCWPQRNKVELTSIKSGKRWDWYVEFLFCRGFHGLREFFLGSLKRRPLSTTERSLDNAPI